VEIVTVSLDITVEGSRRSIDAANPEHPSLVDPTHKMDVLFGVVNIPNVIWIDESGMIVRPPEPGWPGGQPLMPTNLISSIPKTVPAPNAPARPEGRDPRAAIGTGQDRATYHEAIRDWAAKGAASEYALSAEEVVARSEPRPLTKSEGAAHFELANHLWRVGEKDLAIEHFNECNRLVPDNWTYKRQGWSLVGSAQVDSEYAMFVQGPLEGEEAAWPFESDFWSDVSNVAAGGYYPKTM
jgi:hypothetical protein